MVNLFMMLLATFSLLSCSSSTHDQLTTPFEELPSTVDLPESEIPLPDDGDPQTLPDGTVRFVTSSGGTVKLTDTRDTTLPSNSTYHGFAADSSHEYLLLKIDLGNGIERFYFKRRSLASRDNWDAVCDLLDDGDTGNLFGVDDGNFVVTSDFSYNSFTVRKIDPADCSVASTLTVPLSYDTVSFKGLSVSSGVLYIPLDSYTTHDGIVRYDLNAGQFLTTIPDDDLGTKNTDWACSYCARPLVLSSSAIWSLDTNTWSYSCYSGTYLTLWKTAFSGTAQAFAHIPLCTYVEIGSYYTEGPFYLGAYMRGNVYMNGDNHLIAVGVRPGDRNVLRQVTFDVSDF